MNKKLIALFALAPMMLASCQPGTEGNSSSSSTGNDSTPVSSTPGSSSSSSSEDVPPSPVELANYQKTGYVEVNLDWDQGNSEGQAGLIKILEAMNLLPVVNYSSNLTATYTKADNIFQYTGENANFNLTLHPNQAHLDEESESADATAQVINNFKTLDSAYNIFNKVQDLLDTFSSLIPFDVDLTGIARPAYYRTASGFYADAAKTISSDTLASNPAAYANQISVSLLNGHNGYFTDVNPEIKASDGTHGTLRGYEEFTIGSGDTGAADSGIMGTIMDLINGLGSLDIDFENLDIPGLLNLLLTFIPEFDFDINDYPEVGNIVDYIQSALDIIFNGLTASYHINIDEATGDSEAVFTVAIEGEGLDILGALLGDVAGGLLGMTPEITMNDLSLQLTFNKPATSSSYEFGEIAIDTNFGLGADSIGALSYGTDLHLALGFEPTETLVSDTYFTDLAADMAYYSNLGKQYHAFFDLIKNYTRFGSSEGVSFDISEAGLEAKLNDLQSQFEALPADVKAMFPADLDVTAEYDTAVSLFEKVIADTTTLDSVATVNKIYGPLTTYTGWREFLGTFEGGAEALTKLDQAISTLITGRQAAMTELAGAYDPSYTAVQGDAKPATIEYLTTLVNALPSSAEMATFDAGILTAEQQASFDAVDTSLLNAIPEQIFSFFGTTSGWTTDAGDDYSQLVNFYNTIYAPLTSSHHEIIEQLTALINEYQVNMAWGLETDTLYQAVSEALKAYDGTAWTEAGYQAQLDTLKAIVSALWPSAPADYLESLEQIQTLIDLGDSWAQ